MEPTLYEPQQPVRAQCCTADRAYRTLAVLPIREVIQILENNEVVEAKCEFCGTIYTIDKDMAQANIEERMKDEATKIESKSKAGE